VNPQRDGEAALRRAVIVAAQALNRLRINQGTSGNVSARLASGEGLLVTPSGVAYERLAPRDIVALDSDGVPRPEARWAPSSEWRMHLAIYAARDDAGAIVHTHGPFSTTLACLQRPIPPFHYMVGKAGGADIRCAPYATYGTEQLARLAVEALCDRRACLLAHHGMIAIGSTVDEALAMAIDVESLAEVYWRALQIAEPALLSAEEMAVVVEKFGRYGPHRGP